MASKRQENIMAKAMEIIAQDGMGGLTMATLSRRLGVSDGAIYRHFDSKSSIIKEILNDLFYRVSDLMLEEMNKEAPAKDKLRRITGKLYFMFEQDTGYVSLLFSEEYFFSDEEIFYTMHTIVNTMQIYIRQILEQGIERNEMKKNLNSQNISLLIMGSMRMIVLNWRLKRSHHGLKKAGEDLMQDIFELIAK
jgi:AcrR family transcriptional regulator